MIPTSFEYHAPTSIGEALALLGRHGDGAKLLAGGHSLLPALKLRLQSVEHLIDLGRVPDLRYLRGQGGTLAIGALSTHHMVESAEIVRQKCPLLAECAAQIGDMQVRNRGTIGGSLAHADPAADYPAAVLALEAEIDAAGSGGTRTLRAEDFFVDMLTTALGPGEIVTEIRVPEIAKGTGGAYLKVPQPASGFAIVGVAALVTLDGRGRMTRVRVGVTGAAVKAFRARETENALAGQPPDEKVFVHAAALATKGVEPSGDLFASAEYRAHLVSVFVRRALAVAVARARA
jgi:carbon-monoxide dehydrogenase medium subunit